MENILQTILEEIRGVKEDVRNEMQEMRTELREEMQEMKTELREEMQEMKTELIELMDVKLKETKTEIRKEMDERFNQQSKEIGEELSNVVIFLEKRDNELKELMTGSMKVQNEILRELERNRAEHEAYNTRLHKIELTQAYMEEKLLKSS